MRVLTHRGLDPSRPRHPAESTREAFADQLRRGFGLEFDLQAARDGRIVVCHDDGLSRITGGRDVRRFADMTLVEALRAPVGGGRLIEFRALLRMSERIGRRDALLAIHLKRAFQTPRHLDLLLAALRGTDHGRYFVFDATPRAASYLKKRDPALIIAASVAHPFDIRRYGRSTGGTLLPLKEVLRDRKRYDWAWLDEWDRRDAGGRRKSLLTRENFAALRARGLKIAVVSPELHRTSPALLGGESHPDAASASALKKRLKAIIALGPDIICTDYPDLVRRLAGRA